MHATRSWLLPHRWSYSWNLDFPTRFANAEALDPAVPEAEPVPLDFPVTEVRKFPLGLPDILSQV